MPQQIKINDFSAGWIPTDDAFNGRKNGLLKMTGVCLDENGALVLQNGTLASEFTYTSEAHTFFSKLMCGGIRHYVALKDGSVWRNNIKLIDAGQGSTSRAAFGIFGDYVLIFSGSKRLKDQCLGTGDPLTLNPPSTAPGISLNNPVIVLQDENLIGDYANYIAQTGTCAETPDGLEITVSNNVILNKTAYVQNFNPADFPKNISGLAKDPFVFKITATTSLWRVLYFTVTFFLDDGTTPTPNTYTYTWDLASILAQKIDDYTAQLRILREDFQRQGENSTLDWSAVQGISFGVSATLDPPDEVLTINTVQLYNSAFGALNGSYTWLQVNVLNNGNFTVQSIPGPASAEYNIINSYVTVTPEDTVVTEPQATEIWIFRRGGNLPAYYRVKVLQVGSIAPFTDNLSDIDALTVNIRLDTTVLPVNSNNIPEDIIEMVGPIFNRMIYFTASSIYFSLPNNPDSFKPTQTIKITGDSSEFFQFARKVSENAILVGTTRDVYLITGTFIELPDGYLDVYVRPLGTNKPPMSRFATVYNGQLIYFASQAWIMLAPNGNYITLTSPALSELYLGKRRYEYGGIPTYIASLDISYSCAVAKDKLWVVVPIITDYTSLATINNINSWTYRLEIFDLVRKYWTPACYAPYILSTSDDEALFGFMKTSNRIDLLDDPFNKLLNSTGL